MVVCQRCATENPDGFRFCGACGAALFDEAPADTARKVVTALFCDVVDSTALGEKLDPEVLGNLINRYLDEMRTTVERHGGTVQKYAGDGLLAVFGIPRVHEDDALRAVRAADEIRRRVPSVAEETGVALRLRTGVNTGLVLTDEGRSLALGDAVNLAARLEQAAEPGEILLGAETLRLVRDAVQVEAVKPLRLKGKSELVSAFRLTGIDPHAPGRSRGPEVPIVGRQRELGLLWDAWASARRDSAARASMIMGAAGVGKSRLVGELAARLGDQATTLVGRCLPYGEGITFWPLAEALGPLGERARPLLEQLETGAAATPEELFLQVRRLLEGLASERPVIFHVDDLHWAEPMLLDLLENVVGLWRGSAILFVGAARHEFLELHPRWLAAVPGLVTLTLEPLERTECEALLDLLEHPLPAHLRSEAIRTSEGNPLFLQEMTELAREQGVVSVPPSITALLAARLERVADRERKLLERGAVEGEVFHRRAVQVLTAMRAHEEVEEHLARLEGKDLIRRHEADLLGSDTFRFRHLLIRDAAYERLPKATRADLHSLFASWLEEIGVGLFELHEIAGWHLEQSVRYLEELDRPVDLALKRRAADHLHAAGRRAAERSDASAARSLLERALALADEGRPLHNAIRMDLTERLIEAGELGQADDLLKAAEQHAEAGDQGAVMLNRLEWLLLARPEEAARIVEARLPGMLAELARAGDDRRIARAHMLTFWAHWGSNQATLATQAARLAAEHAGRADDAGLRARALGWYVVAMVYGPAHADAIASELEAIEAENPGPYLSACADLGRGQVARLRGGLEAAAELTERARSGFDALGLQPMAAGCAQELAQIELTRGRVAAARDLLLECDARLARLGERPQRATTQSMLARVRFAAADTEGAKAAIEQAENLSAPGDAINFAVAHSVRAQLSLDEGDAKAAEAWARSALEHALRTDFSGLQAEARLGLARLLETVGRSSEAQAEAARAHALCTAKGDRPGSEACLPLLPGA